MKRRLSMPLGLIGITLLAASAASAQEPVRPLQDLVGARGRDGEAELNRRGYQFVRTEKEGDSSYGYWREGRSNRCVSVRTSDGRYQALVYTPDSDCQTGESTAQLPAAAPGDGNSFDTVCGVETDGKTYRYRCHLKVEGCGGQGYCRTVVTMPDNGYTLEAVKGGGQNQVQVTFQGMNPQRTTTSFSNGQTRFELDGKTYFVYRSPERARRELATLN